MKKTIWIILIILVGIGGYILGQRKSVSKSNIPTPQIAETEQKTFISADQSITLKYPDNLSVSQKNNIITLRHTIKYQNYPACDFKGDAPQSPTLTDFNTTVQLLNLTVASTAVMIDQSMGTYTNDNVLKLNPGFIDIYNKHSYNGYVVTQGVEGCGVITYYLPISSSRTLVIQKDLIGAFSDIASSTEKQKILAIPDVISPEQSETIFDSLIQSINIR